MTEYGVPEEVLSDNGKQFTGRFGALRPAEVLFERICRHNGITQRLTKPRSPTTTGKVEQWHRSIHEMANPGADTKCRERRDTEQAVIATTKIARLATALVIQPVRGACHGLRWPAWR